MITHDSILRRLPPNLDRRQALFFDGIRHAAEMATFAKDRLTKTLTQIAIGEYDETEASSLYTSAFLDAWSIVDVIDRFRALWSLLPKDSNATPPSGIPTFAELSQPIRNLRNVADHLAQRAEYVIAHEGSALGVLNWFTALSSDGPTGLEGVICTIAPGTIQPGRVTILNPLSDSVELPTGAIHLSAGEFTASFADVFSGMAHRIKQFEAGLERQMRECGLEGTQAGADRLIKVSVTILPTDEIHVSGS